MTIARSILCAVPLLLTALPASAEPPRPCQDTTAIQWVLPGQFEEARARAARDNRILLMKGIAFGVDAEGAACATKGCW